MPRVFYEDEFDVSLLSDEDLKSLMEKYKEKLQRYTVFLNEEKERTERKILIVHLEQVKRFHMKTNNNI
jgi:NDP-sugar pyrophosphorylase family protein